MDSFDHDSFVIRPTKVKYFHRKPRIGLFYDPLPLTFIEGHRSQLFVEHARQLDETTRKAAAKQICGIADEHRLAAADLYKRHLLRASVVLEPLFFRLRMSHRIGIY